MVWFLSLGKIPLDSRAGGVYTDSFSNEVLA